MQFSVVSISFAGPLVAEGFGDYDEEARANAISELSFMIFADVKSTLTTNVSDDPNAPKQIVSKQTDVTSALPIYGAEFKVEQVGNVFNARVTLSPEISIPLYKSEIDKAVNTINGTYKVLIKEESSSTKYNYVMSALTNFENLQKLKAVLSALGGDYKKYPNVTIDQLNILKRDLTYQSDSMKHVADLFASELKSENVYVYYPMYNGSDEVTPFASVFREMISSSLKSVESIHSADFFIETLYNVSDSGLYLSATLTDKTGKSIAKSVKMLKTDAYKGLDVEPKSISFEKLLKLGLSKSSDFTTRISTSNGKKAMLYKSADAVEIFVKLNKPGYFFIVGHVDKDGQRFSYLVDFYNAKGNRKFIRFIDADEINKWLSIGEFDIVPPFGLETFQMIASLKDPIGLIPANVFDANTELYIVSNDIKKAVVQTRALKKRQENVNVIAEDILIFSTIEK
ncbi:MAG: hypothetical protein C0603_01080 [Denitrovibrio sp.]|nr:MAG: hypothetical protein C0603_01080 [Denitrovibrio sp.]